MSSQGKLLFEAIQPSRPTAIVDIGANPIDGLPPYREMLDAGICTVVGFEPQQDALTHLLRRKGRHEQYLPYVIGDGSDQVFTITAAPGMSSLLTPDPVTLELFTDFDKFGQVVRQQKVSTKRLDDVSEIENIDFLKIDIQGAELAAIRSGASKLADAVAIQVEVAFVPLYSKQPSFGEVDLELRRMGFMPHCFAEQKTWPIAPFRAIKARQLLEADLVYVRDFKRTENLSGEQWKHLALLAHHCYRSYDLAMYAIKSAVRIGAVAADVANRYSGILNQPRSKARK